MKKTYSRPATTMFQMSANAHLMAGSPPESPFNLNDDYVVIQL